MVSCDACCKFEVMVVVKILWRMRYYIKRKATEKKLFFNKVFIFRLNFNKIKFSHIYIRIYIYIFNNIHCLYIFIYKFCCQLLGVHKNFTHFFNNIFNKLSNNNNIFFLFL